MQLNHPDIVHTVCNGTDNIECMSNTEYGFEGPEKKLEVRFKKALDLNPEAFDSRYGLRSTSQEVWQDMLDEVKCKILSKTSNQFFDAFVLSESSLFVFPFKIVLKTCGTTVLLRCCDKLLTIAKEKGLDVEFVMFSRKNLVFPQAQSAPHRTFDEEVAYLDQYFHGHGYVFGSIKHDHWYLYVADYSDIHNELNDDDSGSSPRTPVSPAGGPSLCAPSATLEIMMHDLDPDCMKYYFKSEDFVSGAEVTEKSGISGILPGSTIDEFAFDPCGYSMNGLLGKSYSTIHITPEDHCSYVSYETNISCDELESMGTNYTQIIERVINVFKPGRFTLAIFADNDANNGTKTHTCFEPKIPSYGIKFKTFYELFDTDHNLSVCSYVRNKQSTTPIC